MSKTNLDKEIADRAQYLRTAWQKGLEKTAQHPGELADTFFAMSGESSLTQKGVSTPQLKNGHAARMMVHVNETNRRKNNPANADFADKFTNVGTLRDQSHIISKPDDYWKTTPAGVNPGLTWFDKATGEPKFDKIAQSLQASSVALHLIEQGTQFVLGTLPVKGIPSDAYHYGNGPDGLTRGAVEIPRSEITLNLYPTFKLGRKAPRQDAKGGRAIRAAEGGGDTGPASSATEVPMGSTQPQENGGPRIVVNPKVFSDKRDALCVAMNEAFRVIMEMNGFEPVSEPTEKQRRFFADTAYADDELMLRRTILARICTFDTSIS